ncbi:MAG: hypothetical protein H6618_01485 [Deltaproteobacteria bacterium]|nr:hypothetical protein [Deltaproteobacteria bacterium]
MFSGITVKYIFILWILIGLTGFFLSDQLFAYEDKQKKQKGNEYQDLLDAKIDARIEALVFPDRSIRNKRKYLIMGGFGLIGAHIQGGYYLHQDLMLSSDLYYQKDIIGGSSLIFGCGLKRFFDNSFYLNLSFALHSGRQINYVNSVIGEKNDTFSYDGGLNFGLGNEWNLPSGWVLGGEWLGVYVALLNMEGRLDAQFRAATLHIGYSW